MVSATLVSSLVTRAEELSSPYVEAARQRSPLVDRTASKVAELAKQYEVESYVKKADELADKAATGALARLPEATKSQLASALAKSPAEHQELLTAYASGKVDSLAASVFTLVDRMLPEEEEPSFTSESTLANVKALPTVVYRRGNKAAQLAFVKGHAKGAAAVEFLGQKQTNLRVLAAARKEMLQQQASKVTASTLELIDELRDEFDQRSLPLRDAAAVKKAELQLKYRAALAAASARRGLYTEMLWAQLRERELDVYILKSQRQVAVFRAAALARAHEWRIVAAEKTQQTRTLFIQQSERVIAVTVSAKDAVRVQVVAVKSQLTQQWQSLEHVAKAKLADVSNSDAAQRTLAASAEARAVLAANGALAVQFVQKSTAPVRARVQELAAPAMQSASEKLALGKEKAAGVLKATPAAAGAVAGKLLGEERGVEAEKHVARLLEALPLVSAVAA